MITLPVRSLPGLAWPVIPAVGVSQLWALHLELERSQWLDPQAIVAGQLAQVRTLLAHCAEHVPYYRDLFARERLRPEDVRTLDDFRRIPLLQRAVYQHNFASFQAAQLPPGMVKVSEDSTSGTSGMPVTVWMTNTVALWWLACYLRDLVWSDLDPRRSLAVIRYLGKSPPNLDRALQGMVHTHWHSLLKGLLDTGPAHIMDLRQDMAKQLDWLLRVQPEYLFGAPPNIEYLGGLLVQSGQKLHNLLAVQVFSETLTPEMRVNIETAFGVPVKNLYSCTECGYLASPCPQGHGLHVHAENVLLEVIDDHGRPCGPGETGRVILTPLHNFNTPFIRYEILDGATLGPERCPCGRGLPLLTNVQGRQRPLFRLPNGTRKDARPLFTQFPHGISWQRQIVQRALDHVVVKIVPRRDNWRDDVPQRITEVVQSYFEAPVRVEVQLFERLEVPPGGKIRDIVSEVP